MAQRRRRRAGSRRSSPVPVVMAVVVIGVLVIGLIGTLVSAQRSPSATPVTRRTYNAPPPMLIDPARTYLATIRTSGGATGEIVVRLRPDLAPQTVNSFVFLARERFYDGLTFHRVIQGFMAQGGDPRGDGSGDAGYALPAEFPNGDFDRPGIVAMARSNAPDSAGSQFFITTAPAPHLNGQYTIFGEVLSGQEVVNAMPSRMDPANPDGPLTTIMSITISEQ